MQLSEELKIMTDGDLVQHIQDTMFLFQQELAGRYDGRTVELHPDSDRDYGGVYKVTHVKVVEGEVVLEVLAEDGHPTELAASQTIILR